MISEKFCLECGETLKGRADKKFCDDQCRSNFNNKMNSAAFAEMRIINSILRRNRRILWSVVPPAGKTKVSTAVLHDKGFNFNYFTHHQLTRSGKVYRLCYDYGYQRVDNDWYKVVRWRKNAV